jgi:[ribosomal protein S18]-alanine N-acetyltransferase
MVGEELSSILISAVRVGDLPEILEIEKSSFTTPWSETLFHNEILNSGSVCRVARINGQVAGYLFGQVILDEGHILNLAVRREQRKKGIASLLIQDMIGIMRNRNCRSVFLETRISNEQARSIYEKFGFTIIGTRREYYVAPVEDAVILTLKLTV